jgi:uncharacterized protein (DUF1501 family)
MTADRSATMTRRSMTPGADVRLSRRRLMLGTGMALGLPTLAWAAGASGTSEASGASVRSELRERGERILVVFELSGGNDGLNTVVPYADDAYHRQRPRIGIKANRVRRLDERFGLNPGMAGLERLYKDGQVAIVHGCGYDNPSYSHFTSMAYLHTAAPNSGEETGWVGRLAAAMKPQPAPNYIVNIDATQSLAVQGRVHVPLVFDEPERFARNAFFEERPVLDRLADADVPGASPSQRFLADTARSARDASALVRQAWANYKSPVDYGIVPVHLNKVAALIAAGLPARLYYVAFRNNAFDTHVQQADLHQRLLTYASDAMHGFMRDMERIGRADDVAMLVFSEFGRRAGENTSLGTDHGTANAMFLVGKRVLGGHYGAVPDLNDLDFGGNLRHTTDFRRVYATVTQSWLGVPESAGVLRGKFEPLPIFR